jgi:Uma2 family endonuclease
MGKTLVILTPNDHDKRMSLDDFDEAEATPGHLYELSRGVITVSDVPGKKHFAQFNALRRILSAYDLKYPGRIHSIGTGSESKLLLSDLQSKRHPDLTIYKTPPPDDHMWSTWIPELVIEIVSPGSETRDYGQKPDEYFAFGVMEYWIVDASKEEILVMRRSAGKWATQVLKADAKYNTRLLPDFELDVAPIFAAARSA